MLRVDKNNFQLHFEAIAFSENNKAYGASADFNGLFKIDMQSGKCKYIDAFPDEDLNGKRLYFSAAYYKDKVFFAPQSAEHIAIYDTINNEIEMIAFDVNPTLKFNKNMKFADIVVLGENIFLIGATYPYILRIDAETYELEYISLDTEESFCFRKGGCINGENFFVPSVNSNLVLEFNMKTKQVIFHKIPCEFNGSWSMCYDGKFFWLIPRMKGTGFIRWDKETDQAVVLKDFPQGFCGDSNLLYIKAYYLDGYVWAIPEQANMFLKVDVNSLKIIKEDLFPILKDEKVGFYFARDNELYLVKKGINEPYYGQTGNYFFKLDVDTLEVSPYCFLFAEGYERFRYDRMIEKAPYMVESEEMSLENFLGFISYSLGARD